jgi:hypothetical protein
MTLKNQEDTEKLAKLFQDNKIATMEELKRALGTQVDVTVFRKMRQLPYRTSYSHRGSYYTLDTIAQFDESGLWSCRSACFSRHGNLLQTATAMVDCAEAGYFAKELEGLLGVSVKDALLKLSRQGKLQRQRLSGQYLYLSADPAQRKRQLLARRIREEDLDSLGPPPAELSRDEIKAALILFLSLLDEKQRRVYAGLESLKWGHGGDRKIAELFGMDVGTIARGRRELLDGDVETQRVRRAGAGRKPVEKKRRT